MVQIPNYTLKKERGSNSVATTYLAESEVLNNHLVTLNIIHNDIAKKDAFREYFLAIGQRIKQLKHPYLTKVHAIDISIDTNNNNIIGYMATEYFQQDLNDIINNNEKPLTIAAILTIIKRIGEALSYIHQQGFVHGNINPSSILFDHNNNAKLADSGIAELLEHVSSDLTYQDTLHYISPEQAAMTPTDHRTDIYSLGLVLYEMLTTQKAFTAETTAQAIYQHTMLCPADLPTAYSYLQPVLDKALAKSPSDRYTTVAEMLDALEEAAVDIDAEYVPPAEKQKSKKSWLVAGIIGGTCILSALTLWFFAHKKNLNSTDNNQVAINQLSTPLAIPTSESTILPKKSTVEDRNKTRPLEPLTLLNSNTATNVENTNVTETENVEDSIKKEERNHIVDTDNNDSKNKNQNEIDVSTTKEADQTAQINKTEIQPVTPTSDSTSSNIKDAVPSSKISIKVIAAKDEKPLTTRIVITSKPNNEVIVDGKDKDVQQKQFELEAGEYEVRIEKSGYITQSQALTITDAPQDELIFRLKPIILTGQLKLTAVSKKAKTPLQADYEVRGIGNDYHKQRSKRTSARFKLPSGKYRFSVRYNDKVISKNIKIDADQITNKQVAFTLAEPKPVVQHQEKQKKQQQSKNHKKDKTAEKTTTEPKKSAKNNDNNYQDKAEPVNKRTNKSKVDTTPEDTQATNKEKNTRKEQKVVLGRIYITAKLGNEQGRHLPARFSLYQNKKLIKETANKQTAQFQVPPGKYLIKVTYQGVSSQAKAVLKSNEVIEQTFVYDNIPVNR